MVARLSLVLAIEISNPSAWTTRAPVRPGIAVGRLTAGVVGLIGCESIDPTRQHDDDLIPAIDRLFTRCQLSSRDIRRIAVSIGPGGFTATRIAVTAAKFIAQAADAACIGVPSAAVAFAALSPNSGQTLPSRLLGDEGSFAHRQAH